MTQETEKSGQFSATAILFAVWAVVLLIAFFTNRGADVGRIGQFAGSLGGGPLVGPGFFDSLAGAAAASLIVVSWFGLGNLVLSFVRTAANTSSDRLIRIVLATASGAAIWSLVWFFLGLFGAYGSTAAAVSIAVGLALAVVGFRGVRQANSESRAAERPGGLDRVLIALIAVPVLLAFIASLAPPTAKDTLLYHFAVPKAYIAQGNNSFIDGHIASYLALGTEMHNVWSMLTGGMVSQRAGEAAAGAISFAYFPLLLVAIYGWSRQIGIERRWALLATLIVAAIPTAFHVAANAYIDLALALFVTLAVYALSRWWVTLQRGWLILIAIFLGAALSAKLTSVFVIAAFALIVVFRARKAQESEGNLGAIFAGGFAALAFACVIASPWYLRTWKETGSPIFPFYMSIWPGTATGWDVERSNYFQAMNSAYGGAEKTPLDFLLAPWNLSVGSQPEVPAFFDGVLGPAFLFGLVLVVWALWKFEIEAEVQIGVAVAAIMFLFWLFSSQQLRYLLPIVPLLAVAIAAAGQKVSESVAGLRRVVQAGLAASAIAGILTGATWFMQKGPLRVTLGGESRDAYLTRNIDYYPYYQWLNTESPVDAKVWLINMRRDTYNLDRPYFSDYLFEDWTLKQMVWESRNSAELKAKAAAMGVQYVLSRHDFLFDYTRSPLVDDSKPKAENEAKLKFAKELLLDPTRTVRSDQRFSLVKVF